MFTKLPSELFGCFPEARTFKFPPMFYLRQNQKFITPVRGERSCKVSLEFLDLFWDLARGQRWQIQASKVTGTLQKTRESDFINSYFTAHSFISNEYHIQAKKDATNKYEWVGRYIITYKLSHIISFLWYNPTEHNRDSQKFPYSSGYDLLWFVPGPFLFLAPLLWKNYLQRCEV